MPVIFSYGTLQQKEVQRSTLARAVAGRSDDLVEFELASVRIRDSARAAVVGKTHHANVVPSAGADGRVSGTALEVSDAELALIDVYELEDSYRRIVVTLASGTRAWVYVHMPRIDHLVYAVPDLEQGIDDLERRLGVRAAYGGQHLGRGTHNAILGLGLRCYLEIIARDPAQPGPAHSRWFQADSPELPRLVSWAMACTDIDRVAADAAARGVMLGPVADGSRTRAGGDVLRWRFTDPTTVVADGLVPFLIDWAEGPHPSDTAPGGITLRSLHAGHPASERVSELMRSLEAALPVEDGPTAMLTGELDTPRGVVALR